MLALRTLAWRIKRVVAQVGIGARNVEWWLTDGSGPACKSSIGGNSALDEYKSYLDVLRTRVLRVV